MCRRAAEFFGAITLLVAGATSSAASDPVAIYLERHGLQELLALHLEGSLGGLVGPERDELIMRLVQIYADLLETEDDSALLLNLENRSRKLLVTASADAGTALQLALLRGSYRAAEKIAENHRLRQSSPEEIERAVEKLEEIIPQLHTLRTRIDERHRQIERRLARAGGNEAAVLTEQAERYERMLTKCLFLNAWSQYYQSWLNGRKANARVAEELFAELLHSENPRPRPQDISLDLRALEGVARSILGMALCKSLTTSRATALSWVELLEKPATHSALRAEAPAWRMAINLEHLNFDAALDVLTRRRENQEGGYEPTPIPWVRLAAVHALEQAEDRSDANRLARVALTMLAARGELRQVLDLSERYGTGALGHDGFAFRYVEGVQGYESARTAHADEKPTTDSDTVAAYEKAITSFTRAMAEPDSSRYPEAATSCSWLIGWSLYFQSNFSDARATFEAAAEELDANQSSEAMWMAVVCLDRVVRGSDDPALIAELVALIERVLERFPSSPHVSKLVLKKAIIGGESSQRVVDDLLSIRPESEVYDAAQLRAAYLLYRLFRESRGEQKISVGIEYLALSVGRVGAWDEGLGIDDRGAVEQYVARSRRVLEVALTSGIDRLSAALRVLDDLHELFQQEGVDVEKHVSELGYRRVQVLLATSGGEAAVEIAEGIWQQDTTSLWSRSATRAIFEHAHRRWRDAEGRSIVDKATLELVVHAGQRLIGEMDSRVEMRFREGILAYYATVAEAEMLLWQRTDEAARGEHALELYERVLAVRGGDASSLKAVAVLASKLDRPDRALECWRTLVAGLDDRSPGWYEAKFNLIALLTEVDPARARAVMDQHKVLQPSYGPDPWAARLEALDGRIPGANPA